MNFLDQDFYSKTENIEKYQNNYYSGIGCTLRNFLLFHCIQTLTHLKNRIGLNQ